MRSEQLYDQIQRLLGARDQKAFSRLLIDSVCSMPTDDFHRVREKLIRRFVDEQSKAENDVVWPEAKIESADDELVDGRPQTGEELLSDVLTSDSFSSASSALPLKIVDVRSCGDEEMDDVAWLSDVQTQSRDDHHLQDFTTANYITIEPIETTTDSAPTNYDYNRPAADYRTRGDQTQCLYSDDTNAQSASTSCQREPE